MVKLLAGEVKGPLDRFEAVFDDGRSVAHAGLILSATLAERLGIKEAADEMIMLGEVAGAAFPGRKVMTLIHAMALGGDSIDDTDILRSGETSRVLGHRVMAPSTLGTFLRAFTFGHVRQLDRLSETVLARAWRAGACPDKDSLEIDIDSSICEVYGHQKQGRRLATPKSVAITPCLPRAQAPARCSMRASAKERPTPPEAPRISSPRCVDACVAPVPRAVSACAPTRAFTQRKSWTPARRPMFASPSPPG